MAQLNEKIKSLVRGLFEDKQVYKELDESISNDTKELKKWMSDKKANVMDVDNIHVTYSPQVRSSMNEDKTIEILKQRAEELINGGDISTAAQITNCIKTKQVVDELALEDLIYNDVIQKELLEPAMNTKIIYVLKMHEIKARK